MTIRGIIFSMFGCLLGCTVAFAQQEKPQFGEIDFAQWMQPVPRSARLADPDYFIWGASAVKGDDGKYHLFYSRWPAKDGMAAWLTRSEIAHAVSDSPLGPFVFSDLTLPVRGAEYWDGLVTHNPMIRRYEGKYYLYYMGTTGNGIVMKETNNDHRGRQQIGVAVADSPYGPWTRFDKPIIAKSDYPDAPDVHMCANPAIVQRPDGKYILIYKANSKKLPEPKYGPMTHLIAISDSPAGPFTKTYRHCFDHPDPEVTFPTEDATLWYQDGRYYAVLKDMGGFFTGKGKSLALFVSTDGFDWKPAENLFISVPEIHWEDGIVEETRRLERPQILLDEHGVPMALYCAVTPMDTKANPYNVHIPLKKPDFIQPLHKVTLNEAHRGDLVQDTRLLDSYGLLPDNVREFYLQSRAVFSEKSDANFTDAKIIDIARKYNMPLMSGPMLGNLTEKEITIWLRPSTADPLVVKVTKVDGSGVKSFSTKAVAPGVEQRIVLNGLKADTEYKYGVYIKDSKVAEGRFTTAPTAGQKGVFRLTFGSCAHKIGIHNPNLFSQILKREPQAMMLLGDIAADDRDNKVGMHRSDYLLRDVSKAWRSLAANVPLYAAWDDHDYFNNDLGGIPTKKGFTAADREALRAVWRQNWNNPENKQASINFNTRVGPVELIMLDTRSCRDNERQGQYGSFIGAEQLVWLKDVLKKSKAPFKVISGGTMWSDYITPGKDSWGIWDVAAREEIFNFIEKENIAGVLLISGDRHGARGFTIPRPSGFSFYEFEAGSLGGVEGPEALAKDASTQLFGYFGTDIIGFGEFTFDTKGAQPVVTFRLINEFGKVLEEHVIPYNKLTPREK